MKPNWKTTLAGILAAIGPALAETGALPQPWGTVAQLISAIGLVLLGYSAADRPKPPATLK